jgi:anti-sigma regulatory factor (Ser/Thr protein kinase)
MNEEPTVEILLTNFAEADLGILRDAIGGLGRRAVPGDPVNDTGSAFVLAAAYDETSLRGNRAAALEEKRPWCFCVPASDRSLVAAAASAREGHMLLLPPELRELKRVLSTLSEDAKERGAGNAAFSGLRRLEAEFSWKTSSFEVSLVCRRIARLLAESGFYADRAGEDECALALEEALVNSVEHGNLSLDSSLKPDDSLQEDRYEAERARRIADPAFGDRLVSASLFIAGDEAKVVLEDEGNGFDTSRIDESPSGHEISGKGFWFIKRPFDEAVYNSKGNRLTLVRRKPRGDESFERRGYGYRA